MLEGMMAKARQGVKPGGEMAEARRGMREPPSGVRCILGGMAGRASITLWALAASALAVLVGACGGDGEAPEAPTATVGAVAEELVVVDMTTGCDRPQPERGTEALALVTVTFPDGTPVIGAQVEGDIAGPDVAVGSASDATTLEGEALLFFVVGELGEYTITVEAVTLPGGATAVFDEASTLSGTFEVGEVCTPP